MVQWLARLTVNLMMLVSHGVKSYQRLTRCFLDQETLPPLLSTGWLQEQI